LSFEQEKVEIEDPQRKGNILTSFCESSSLVINERDQIGQTSNEEQRCSDDKSIQYRNDEVPPPNKDTATVISNRNI